MKYISKTRQAVTAWKYEKGVGVPIWVARRCHDLGDGKFTANTIAGPVPIDLGDYVAVVEEELNAVTVVDGNEFEKEYVPLPDSGRRVALFGIYGLFGPYESHDGAVGWTVQRLSPADVADPEDFGEQIAEFQFEEDARLFAQAKAGVPPLIERLARIAVASKRMVDAAETTGQMNAPMEIPARVFEEFVATVSGLTEMVAAVSAAEGKDVDHLPGEAV